MSYSTRAIVEALTPGINQACQSLIGESADTALLWRAKKLVEEFIRDAHTIGLVTQFGKLGIKVDPFYSDNHLVIGLRGPIHADLTVQIKLTI